MRQATPRRTLRPAAARTSYRRPSPPRPPLLLPPTAPAAPLIHRRSSSCHSRDALLLRRVHQPRAARRSTPYRNSNRRCAPR
eukprot:3622116-Pleurochrysis_carterae.AAC.1